MSRPLSATRIVGSLLIGPLLLLPIPWAAAVLGARPDPNGHWHPPYPPIPPLAPYMVYLTMWQHPGRALYAAGIAWLGVLVLTWGLLGRRWMLSLAISMLSGLLLLCWAGYSALDTASNYLTYVGGARIGGQQYELITVKYPSGPLYEVLYACDSDGWGCEQVLQDGGSSLKPDDAEAEIRSLLAQPLQPDS